MFEPDDPLPAVLVPALDDSDDPLFAPELESLDEPESFEPLRESVR